jgi:hypothetical protein
MNKVQIFGNRWDENDAALEFEDRFRKQSPTKQLDVLDRVLSDYDRKFGHELTRAAGMILMNRVKSPSNELINKAIECHRFMMQDHDWLDKFPSPIVARREIRQEFDQLTRKLASNSCMTYASALQVLHSCIPTSKLTTASSYVVHTQDRVTDITVELGVFASFIVDAVYNMIESDEHVSEAAKAVEDALRANLKKENPSVEKIIAVYQPLIEDIMERIYKIAGSGQNDEKMIFTTNIVHDIAKSHAVKWMRENL